MLEKVNKHTGFQSPKPTSKSLLWVFYFLFSTGECNAIISVNRFI
ncbi:hypothetical protein PFLA_a2927 [Pseudoalteromonas flavipulchra NCIMB 2033 = ATCC BAA-314]|nr:hypothetical protein [Pseudoalteromonas flavipulchra NCIMB 2033 = ATCC BAA-314]